MPGAGRPAAGTPGQRGHPRVRPHVRPAAGLGGFGRGRMEEPDPGDSGAVTGLNYVRYRCMLLHQEHACMGTRGLKELAEMPRHRLQIGSDQNSAFCGGECQHLGVGSFRQFAPLAERKSMVGSRRKQPLTIASRRLASARKRTILQLRRASMCRGIRSNFSLTPGGVGWVFVTSSSSRSRSAMSFSTALLWPGRERKVFSRTHRLPCRFREHPRGKEVYGRGHLRQRVPAGQTPARFYDWHCVRGMGKPPVRHVEQPAPLTRHPPGPPPIGPATQRSGSPRRAR